MDAARDHTSHAPGQILPTTESCCLSALIPGKVGTLPPPPQWTAALNIMEGGGQGLLEQCLLPHVARARSALLA